MSLPAARIVDMHVCPMFDGPKPHVGGPVTGPGASNVLIGGMPAAVVGDMCTCTGPPDTIIKGSSTVLIGGKPAARLGDSTAHGGTIIAGCPTVLIGDSGGGGGKVTTTIISKNQYSKLPAKAIKEKDNANSLIESAQTKDAFANRTIQEDYSAKYTLVNSRNEPCSKVPYSIIMNDGTRHKGKTDSNGNTEKINGYTIGDGIILFEATKNG